jgi:hypothetical protein
MSKPVETLHRRGHSIPHGGDLTRISANRHRFAPSCLEGAEDFICFIRRPL